MSFPAYDTYKDSGEAWLGSIPTSWAIKRIRHLFEIKKRIAGTDGYDVLSITQQGIKIKDTESGDGQLSMDYSKYQFVEVGDFAMNHMDLLTGYVDISNVKGVTSPDYRVFSIRNKTDCLDRYYLYLFQMGYKNKIFFAFGQGSSQLGRWRFPTDEFNNFIFPVPSPSEQETIASFLDREIAKIDALVAEQERLIELLKEKRQAVISHAVTKGLNPKALMKSSGIDWMDDVPQHWNMMRFRRIISEPLTNGIFKKKEDFGEGTLLVNVFDIYQEDYEIKFHSLDRVLCDADEIERYQVLAGDLFFVRSSLKQEGIAAVALARDFSERAVFECHLIRARPNSKLLDSRYGSYLLNSSIYRATMIANAKITTMTTIDQGAILSTLLPIPPLAEQTMIAAFLDRATAEIDALTKESRMAVNILHERRSALISAAVTGKIDVRGLVKQRKQEAA